MSFGILWVCFGVCLAFVRLLEVRASFLDVHSIHAIMIAHALGRAFYTQLPCLSPSRGYPYLVHKLLLNHKAYMC